jgi:hypothetical protein
VGAILMDQNAIQIILGIANFPSRCVCQTPPVQGLVPRPPAAAAAYEGLLHRLKALIALRD